MILLRAENLCRQPEIAHSFFGRTGGVSKGIFASLNCGPGSTDYRPDVLENRRRVEHALGDIPLFTLSQAHGTTAVTVKKPWPITGAPEADAMVTKMPGIALGILTADCAPVLLADVTARVVGGAHAGWKGALAGVTDAAIVAMEKLGAERSRIVAAIGPSIGPTNYEVGPELFARFAEADSSNKDFFAPSDRADHFRFDLQSYVARRLERARIGDVERLLACTYAEEKTFFSFRRATHRGEADYGRQVSAILLCK
jgi:purine-nucleoside/S-methyl-5'-thioadenosine phosphorylase / adenosine deaminase